MPVRTEPLVTGQVYHVFNQAIDHFPIFSHKKNIDRGLLTLYYYKFIDPGMRLSQYLTLNNDTRRSILESIEKLPCHVQIIAFCLMPNHFHLLVEQMVDQGIQTYISNFQNSFTRYYNIRQGRKGSLLLPRFKAVRIVTNEQLLHVSRYIHLNPLTSFVVDTFDKLKQYPPSSLSDYLTGQVTWPIVSPAIVLDQFSSREAYAEFCSNQASYQQALESIKHLCFEQ
ncbi:hypothetical protein A2W24_05755 [Microgenomates group bacterium RBG_16_45_19]|nr:MAG: hypothetical protein A2W24_05755 [Microgenomates group bacterium RBG_16_45_19]